MLKNVSSMEAGGGNTYSLLVKEEAKVAALKINKRVPQNI